MPGFLVSRCLRSRVLRPACPEVSVCVLVLRQCSNSKRDVEALHPELHTQTRGSHVKEELLLLVAGHALGVPRADFRRL